MSPRRDGALAIVLHTHMPYVEGFGRWPFGEEWLWEAMVGSYLPLLELLEEGAPLTLSLTPVLCDQLQAPGVQERFAAFVEQVRRDTHAQDAAGLRAAGEEALAVELERSWRDYERALAALRRHGGDLVAALAPYARWTSSATHAVLPLLATDAGVRAQVRAGVRSHRRRFGEDWGGGFWLPECGFAPWLEGTLAEEGVRSVCVELTGSLGLGDPRHLRPLQTKSGLLLIPVDRSTMSLVWSHDGYPADGGYRDYHHHTVHHHNPWRNDGLPYDHAAAMALAGNHAADFVARTQQRLRSQGEQAQGGGLVVCALDTELLGHWWYEGVAWLRAVVSECERQGLALIGLEEALAGIEPLPVDPLAERWEPISWGEHGDLSTWSGPAVAEMAFAARAAELTALGARPPSTVLVRELMALQASDWAFMVSRELAGPYPHERFAGHRRGFDEALAAGSRADGAALRQLARDADAGMLAGL